MLLDASCMGSFDRSSFAKPMQQMQCRHGDSGCCFGSIGCHGRSSPAHACPHAAGQHVELIQAIGVRIALLGSWWQARIVGMALCISCVQGTRMSKPIHMCGGRLKFRLAKATPCDA